MLLICLPAWRIITFGKGTIRRTFFVLREFGDKRKNKDEYDHCRRIRIHI